MFFNLPTNDCFFSPLLNLSELWLIHLSDIVSVVSDTPYCCDNVTSVPFCTIEVIISGHRLLDFRFSNIQLF